MSSIGYQLTSSVSREKISELTSSWARKGRGLFCFYIELELVRIASGKSNELGEF